MAKNPNFFGLALPEAAREKLRKVGIFVQTVVTVEHQNLAQRYVVRGVESGGAVDGFGHYVTFAAEDGSPLPYVCRVESLAVNGPHAVVVAPVLLRAEMLRVGHTYELLITRHRPGTVTNGKKPPLVSEVVFRGEHGHLAVGEMGLPRFCSRAGEPVELPKGLTGLLSGTVLGTLCTACDHAHYVVPCEGTGPRAGSGPGPGDRTFEAMDHASLGEMTSRQPSI
ncbi:MAG TPA: hypothetical protein VFZ08_03585 [Terriglobia bacterium]|nr:hypothetical protein [Terriglobia bacterium]